MEKNKINIHERLYIGIILAVAGGAMDTYTFMLQGEVFASMQSANVLLLGINLAKQNFAQVIHYVPPIICFIIGTMLVEHIKVRYSHKFKKIDWQHAILIIEIVLLLIIAVFELNFNQIIINSIISFVAALQVGTYRKLSGVPFSTTMTTGNIRTASEYLYYHFCEKGKKHGTKSAKSFLIAIGFFAGALLSASLYFYLNFSPLYTTIITLIVVLVFTYLFRTKN
ncbi:YoaK family protein [Mycoplasma sp. P36-A1]|uniref:YoaK family protein n=1 Tax=Mycoplasma sp. P36-A1 TaxID=3252900 RepID=UPI003C2DE0BF